MTLDDDLGKEVDLIAQERSALTRDVLRAALRDIRLEQTDGVYAGCYGAGKNLLNKVNTRGMEMTETAKLARMY
jgi:hypothetical protein